MPTKTTIEESAAATLKRLEEKDRGLKQKLKKAYGYAVFPSVGKASLVVGGSYGRGAVFEQGKFIGHATISQLTIGVQLGGDTFSEILLFQNKEALERLKQGKMAFAADASIVLVKAGAAAMKGFPAGVTAYAYSRGGMLLELVIGGQKFKFKAAEEEEMGGQEQDEGEGNEQEEKGGRAKAGKGKGKAAASSEEDEGDEEQEDGQGEEEESGMLSRAFGGIRSAIGGAGGSIRSGVGSAAGGVKSAASQVARTAKAHPFAASVVGTAVAVGVVMLVANSVRGASQQAGADGQEDQDDQEDSEAEGSADEGGEEQANEEEGEESGDTLNRLRRRRSSKA
jgi:hypothetical protein